LKSSKNIVASDTDGCNVDSNAAEDFCESSAAKIDLFF
jgi:hypothetical protein